MGEGHANTAYKYYYIDIEIPIKNYEEPIAGIDKVIFNGPAIIVIWLDGSKTVVKCAEGDGYSKFSGLAIAICKHMYGPKFKKIFNHFISEEETKCRSLETTNSKQ